MQGIEELLKRNYSIIPMKAEVKEAAVYWRYYQNKRATIREIERWHKQFGDTNYAIVCGLISDLGVIDVDDLKMIPALEMMIPNLWDTCVISTPRPGLQFYFKLQGRHIKSVSNLFGLKKVELKAEGRLVMSPGSVIGGVEYIFDRPLTCILPIPKIIVDLYQETNKEIVTTKGAKTEGAKTPIIYRGKAKCISQILNKDIPEPGREMAYFIVYCKLIEAGNTPEYAKRVVKLSNRELSDSLTEKEIDRKFRDKKFYTYGCPRINEELLFINCSNCQVRGGKNVQSILMKNVHKLGDLTNSERGILAMLDSYYKGEDIPTINEIQKKTGMDFYAVRGALEGLKEKKII